MLRPSRFFPAVPSLRRLLPVFPMLISLLAPPMARGAEPVRIGVLAFRPKPQTLAQWEPLAAALKKAIPSRDFRVEAFTYPELNRAVSGRRLDFVLTNPGHFVQLQMAGQLSAPLATLAVQVAGKRVSQFGGVIFTRADNKEIASFSDVRNKTIAVPDNESLGGYQMQAYELYRAGLKLPGDAKLLITGMPHDNVVKAVLEGRADVGFVRSGVLEAGGAEGKFDPGRLKVLNPRKENGFPQLLSTRLYPEWPFAACPPVDGDLARLVAAALFTLEATPSVTSRIGIQGFYTPADYTPVEEMLRELRFPPFDSTPSFTVLDVWLRFRLQIVFGLLSLALIALLGVRLYLAHRRLKAEKQLVLSQSERLQDRESHLRAIIEAEPECVSQLGADGSVLQMNRAGLEMMECDLLKDLDGVKAWDLVVPEDRAAFSSLVRRVFSGSSDTLVFRLKGLRGGLHWLETHAVPLRNSRGDIISLLAVTRDITERRQAELEREAAIARIKGLEGIIPICMHCKKIRDDQNSWNQLEQYITSHSEAVFSHGLCPECAKEHYAISASCPGPG